ncbi:MAG: signal peptidase I [Candidatus Ruminococcus intestinipullorum]|nr:signal peptidase I [Candidatus Ruminococcus intestinipullorum]
MQDLKFGKKRRKQVLKRKKQINREKRNKQPILGWIFQILGVCILAFVLVFYFGQRISNTGESMKPQLNNGDIVLVNRLVYDAMSPKRGDIIAFKPNGNENMHYSIKRIVGLPGESVQIQDGKVYIDGNELKEDIYVEEVDKPGIAEQVIELGSDEYFVLGDNTENSDDSRMANIGNIKRSDIDGKIWFHFGKGQFGFVK